MDGGLHPRRIRHPGNRGARPHEYEEAAPHWSDGQIMWFGHALNFYSVERILQTLPQPLRVVSNFDGAVP